MTQVAYLLDEHVPAAVGGALTSAEPSIQFLHIGSDAEAPVKGTLDPDVLAFAERRRLAVVTFDARTMPAHAAEHNAQGRRTWGVLVFPKGNTLSAGRIAAELIVIWAGFAPEELIDVVAFLPSKPPRPAP